MSIPFSQPELSETALAYVRTALESGQWGGDGPFTARCHDWLRASYNVPTLLTHSCTAALEMSALLADVGPGDEVIMPSFTFVSTANAFVLRGATPVFVDIRPDTLNLDERLIEQAITERTKLIVPVHYAGVACEMSFILDVARAKSLLVVEDAAQGFGSIYRGRPLGTLGGIGTLSFHVTKNIASGEGGAIILNDETFVERAHILREKGTNRTAFMNRKVDRYNWLDIGSSFLPSDILASLLLSQLEISGQVTARRLEIWHRYHEAFAALEDRGRLRRPVVPPYVQQNGHNYYLLLNSANEAVRFRAALEQSGIPALTHYVPLHSAPAGMRFCRCATPMTVTDRTAATLVRLPVHTGLNNEYIDKIISLSHDVLLWLT